MARLAVMLINRGALGSRRILSARSIDAMAQDQTLGSFNPLPTDLFRFGLGWDTVAQPGLGAVGLRAWQKGGDIDGPYGSMYGAALITAPDERLGVVVMGASGVTSSTAAKVAERVLLAALVERGTLPAMPAPLPSTPLPVRAPTAEEKTAYSGFYGASGSLYRVTFLADDSLLLQSRDAGAPGPRFRNMKLRSDGWYATDSDPISAVRFLTRAGRTYLAARVSSGAGHYTSTLLQAQKLDSREPLSAAWQARLGGTWLAANDDAYAAFPDAAPDPRFTFDTLDDLPGYLLIGGTKILCDMTPPASDRANGMFLQIPQVYGRDLVDAAVERRENTDWLRVGSTLYRPLSGVPAAGPGPTTVAIGSEGLAEWRKLPPAGTVAIGGSRAWLLYDADFTRLAYGSGSGSAALPGIGDAAYLMLFGAPGARVTINVNTGQ